MAERHGTPDSMEFAHWQGAIDQTLSEHTRRLDNINGDIRSINQTMTRLERDMHQDMSDMKVGFSTDMAGLKARVGVFAAIGGLVGAGAVSVLFTALVK